MSKTKPLSATSISSADTTIFSRHYNNRETSTLAETETPYKLAEAANKAHGAGAQNPRHRSQPAPRASFAPRFQGNSLSNSKQFTG